MSSAINMPCCYFEFVVLKIPRCVSLAVVFDFSSYLFLIYSNVMLLSLFKLTTLLNSFGTSKMLSDCKTRIVSLDSEALQGVLDDKTALEF